MAVHARLQRYRSAWFAFSVILVGAQLALSPGVGHAATGSWLQFQIDNGYSGFGTACAIDTRRGQAVMFGMWNYPVCFGLNCSPYTNYDITAFARFGPDPVVVTPITLANSPRARSDACAAYDSLADQVWLFGGRFAVDSLCHEFGCSSRPSLDDLWRLDLSSSPPQWHPVVVSGARPAPRYHSTLMVDPVARQLLLFGGHDSTGTAFGDLWSLPLDGPYAWTELHPAGSGPSARWSATALWDPARQRMLLVGGADASGDVADVWALAGTGSPTWSVVSVAGTPPTGIFRAILDVGRDLVLAYGGPAQVATFALSGTATWTPVDATGAPATSTPGGFGYDPVHDVIWVPFEQGTIGGSTAPQAKHWLLTLAQPPTVPALDPVLDSVRYARGLESQWWRLRPRRPGYHSVAVQSHVGRTAVFPAADTTEGGVRAVMVSPLPGQTYDSRIVWTETVFPQEGGLTAIHAPLGPSAMAFTIAPATFDTSGAVHVVWCAATDSLSMLAAAFVERSDAGEWLAVENVWPDTLQRITLDETLGGSISAVDYRIRWAGPLGPTYGGELHLERDSVPPSPPPPPPVEPGRLFLSQPRPNPAGSSATFDFGLPSPTGGTLRLFDVHGREVRAWTISGAGAQSHPLDLHGVNAGMYVLRLEQGSLNTAVRVVIVR